MRKEELIKALGNHLVTTKKIKSGHWVAQGNAEPTNTPDWGYSCPGTTERLALQSLYETLIRHKVLLTNQL